MTSPESFRTTFENKCSILSEIWQKYREHEDFCEFALQNQLGLVIAFAIADGIVEATPAAAETIEESFEALLAGFEYDEDHGWETLEEIFSQAEWMPPAE
jgi:hypothetical protein